MLHSAQMYLHYKPCAGSLHRVHLLEIKRCKTASSIFHWEKKQQSCPISSRAFSHQAKHLPAVPDVLSITGKMNGGGDKAAGSARCWLMWAGAQLRERVPKSGEENMGKAENPISAPAPRRVILVYAAGSLLNCTMTHAKNICRLD